jgi:hypothetical protein
MEIVLNNELAESLNKKNSFVTSIEICNSQVAHACACAQPFTYQRHLLLTTAFRHYGAKKPKIPLKTITWNIKR